MVNILGLLLSASLLYFFVTNDDSVFVVVPFIVSILIIVRSLYNR